MNGFYLILSLDKNKNIQTCQFMLYDFLDFD